MACFSLTRANRLFSTLFLVVVCLLLARGVCSATELEPSRTSGDPWVPSEWRFRKYVAPYDPIYFLMGFGGPAVKFQYSLQVHNTNWWGVPSFAFTQTSFWDIFAPSAPFFDTSYKPTVFVYFRNVLPTNYCWVDFQAGYQHESNGQGLGLSRSMNTIYAQVPVKFGTPDRWHLEIVPRFWFYILDLSDNPDIANYRGYANFIVTAGRTNYNLRTKIQMGDKAQHVGIQTAFSCPLWPKDPSFYPYLHIEYFTGYGETFRGYNKHTDTLRFGIALHE